MKDGELQIDRSCHVLYSKPCKKEILAKITLHYTVGMAVIAAVLARIMMFLMES